MMGNEWGNGIRAFLGRLFGKGREQEEASRRPIEKSWKAPSEIPKAPTLALPSVLADPATGDGTAGRPPKKVLDDRIAKTRTPIPDKKVDAQPKSERAANKAADAKPIARPRAKRNDLDERSPATRPVLRPDGRHANAGARASARPIQLEQVFINLGVDFGTSFTKVCFRDTGTEESFVVSFDAETMDDALLSSVVAVDKKGKLYAADEAPRGAARISYLKMRLAGVPIGDSLPTISGVELASDEATRALASWFLAKVLVRSREWITVNASDRLKNRTVVWSANVGVPVEHYDSPVIETFRQVLGVAWLWVADDSLPIDITDAVSAYKHCVVRLKQEIADFHAIPEIAAAVQSFVMSREAVPGIYVYFDIGGGTVDGVAFKFLNSNGERRVNFYSGKVSPLGISALASALGADNLPQIEERTLERIVRGGDTSVLGRLEHQLRQLVGYVVMKAKQTDGRNWQEDAVQSLDTVRKSIASLGGYDRAKMKPLVVFLGGGGAPSSWYRNAIASTYDRFQHYNAGIPPYHLLEVSAPADLEMTGLASSDFRRFAISYGLSIPFGEGPDVGLPSQFSEPEAPQPRPMRVASYLDSKDAYD
jgi:hypothetical protein